MKFTTHLGSIANQFPFDDMANNFLNFGFSVTTAQAISWDAATSTAKFGDAFGFKLDTKYKTYKLNQAQDGFLPPTEHNDLHFTQEISGNTITFNLYFKAATKIE